MKKKKIILLFAIIIVIAVVILIVVKVNKKDNNQGKQNGETGQNNNSLTNVQPPEKELPNETTDIILYVGEDTKYTQVEAKYNSSDSKEKQIVRLLEKIGIAIGYKIEVNRVTVVDEKITIDFKQTSAPFDDNSYFGGEDDNLFIDNYSTLVYRVFDSIKMTLKSNFGDNIKIYYTVNGKGMTFNNIIPKLTIGSETPYNGAN